MRGTFTIPGQLVPGADTATRVRISSERRYIVLSWRADRWVIEYRTDDAGRARSAAHGRSVRLVLDTVTGEVVR
jgi:hypothetical protein